MKLEYHLTDNGPVQQTRAMTRNGDTSYYEVWTYTDGGGNAVLKVAEADPLAGDAGKWVVSGLLPRTQGSLVYQNYRSWFYSGDPDKHPLIPPGTRGAALEEFAFDARGRVIRRFLGPALPARPYQEIKYHALSVDFFDAESTKAGGPHANTPQTNVYDGHGRKVKSISRIHVGTKIGEIQTEFSYLPTGELTRVEQFHSGGVGSPVTAGGSNFVRWMQYDSLGRIMLNAEPNSAAGFAADPAASTGMKAWRYQYNDAGKLVGTSDARGCGVNYFYDGLGRSVAEDFSPCLKSQAPYSPIDMSSGDGSELYIRYDAVEPGQTGDFGANSAFLIGKPASVRDRGSHTRFAYDARGRAVRTARRVAKPGDPAAALADRYTGTWFRADTVYDPADRPTSISTGADVAELLGDGGASTLEMSYSRRGQMQTVGGSYGVLIAASVADADGVIRSRTFGDAAQTTATLTSDDMLRPSCYTLKRSAPALWSAPTPGYVPPAAGDPPTRQTVLEDVKLGYDDASHITSIKDLRIPGEWPAGAKPVTWSIDYDDLYRVTVIKYAYPSAAGDAFVPGPAPSPPAPVPSLDTSRRATEQDVGYDWMGNSVSSADDANLAWDRSLGTISNGAILAGPNRLVSSTSGVSVIYDASGNVVQVTVERTGSCPPSAKCSARLVYDWDEVGRLARARRWDYAAPPVNSPPYPSLPTGAPDADLRYVYGANGRTLATSTTADGSQTHTVAIFDSLRLSGASYDPAAGDYERTSTTERVYLGELARVVHAPGLPSGNSSSQHIFLRFGNWLGSTTTIIDRNTGELAERLSYLAYGGTDSDYQPARWKQREEFRFNSSEDDYAVGLMNFGARYYSAALGRWISPDPLSTHGAGGELNPYGFAASGPVSNSDRTGLDWGDGCLGAEICVGSQAPVGIDIPAAVDWALHGGSNPGGRGKPVSNGGVWIPVPHYPPPPPVQPAKGAFDPAAGVSDPLARWIMSGNGTFHDLVTSDTPWRYIQYYYTGVAIGAATIVLGEGGAATAVLASGARAVASVLRPMVLGARIALGNGAATFTEMSLAEQGLVVGGGSATTAMAVKAADRMGAMWVERNGAYWLTKQSVGVLHGYEGWQPVRVYATQSPAVYRWLTANLEPWERLAPIVRDSWGRPMHSDIAALRYAVDNGIFPVRLGTWPLGCHMCQAVIEVLFPWLLHENPAPGGPLNP